MRNVHYVLLILFKAGLNYLEFRSLYIFLLSFVYEKFYTKLLKMQNGYVESLNEVGLSSPFEAETYELISQVFSFLD